MDYKNDNYSGYDYNRYDYNYQAAPRVNISSATLRNKKETSFAPVPVKLNLLTKLNKD